MGVWLCVVGVCSFGAVGDGSLADFLGGGIGKSFAAAVLAVPDAFGLAVGEFDGVVFPVADVVACVVA